MSLVEASLRFPTVVFSIGLGIALVYWLFVIIGALDIDLFGHADVAGAGKALGDAATGGGKALGGAKAGGDGAEGGGLWAGLGLADVPITISLSIVLFVCWLLSLLAMHYAPLALGSASWVAPAVLPVTLVAGLPLAGLIARPLGGLFAARQGKSNRDYVGHLCTITTGRVDHDFGQATVEDGGTVLVIPVRCDRPDALARNDRALIIDFDPARQAYLVEPAADVLPSAREPGRDQIA